MKRWLPALLLLVLAAGVAGGLFYTWVLDPIEIYDPTPAALRERAKLDYLALVGDLYAYEQDLPRAEARLAVLGLSPDGAALAGLVERYLDAGGRPEEVRNLARLAEALGASGGVLVVFAGPALSPEPSLAQAVSSSGAAPPGTASAGPAATQPPLPTATPAPSFGLVEQTELCAAPGSRGRIAVVVQDAAGQELAGVQVVASWPGGQDRFWTGLRPALGAGYADLQMAPGASYDVSLASFPGDTAQGLATEPPPGVCPEGVAAVDWQLVFRQSP